MTNIKVIITGVNAVVIADGPLTSGMVGVPCQFIFDAAWVGLTKTAVFRAGNKTFDQVDISDTTTVPWEVLEEKYCSLFIGVYGATADGSVVIPTLWAEVGTIQPGTDPSGDESADPNLPVWRDSFLASQEALQTSQEALQTSQEAAQTSQEALEKSQSISEKVSNIAFHRLIGTDENPIIVGELADGAYYITGIGKWYRSAAARQFAVGIYCVRQSGSYKSVCMLQINTIHRLRWYKVWENKYEETIIELDQIAEHEERLAALENALLVKFKVDTNADGIVARTARAGMTWAEYIDTGIMLNTCNVDGISMDVLCDGDGYVFAQCQLDACLGRYFLKGEAGYVKGTDTIEAETYIWVLEAPIQIAFTIDGRKFSTGKGYTWELFWASGYDTIICDNCGEKRGIWMGVEDEVKGYGDCPACESGTVCPIYYNDSLVYGTDQIIANAKYYYRWN